VDDHFILRESQSDGVAQLHLGGELDLAAKSAINDVVSRRLADAAITRLVIDLAGVTFIDSSGIGTLIGCRNLADHAGKTLQAIGAQGRVARVLDLTGVRDLLRGDARTPPD
jgi:anti-sigma B factor antagonist